MLPQPQQKIDCGGLLDTTTLFELGAGAQWIVPFALGKDGFVLAAQAAELRSCQGALGQLRGIGFGLGSAQEVDHLARPGLFGGFLQVDEFAQMMGIAQDIDRLPMDNLALACVELFEAAVLQQAAGAAASEHGLDHASGNIFALAAGGLRVSQEGDFQRIAGLKYDIGMKMRPGLLCRQECCLGRRAIFGLQCSSIRMKGWIMAANTVVRARIDQETKEEAAIVLAAMGLTLSDAFRIMLTRIAREKALPFEPLVPNAETIEAMKEARRGALPSFTSVDALMADLNEAD